MKKISLILLAVACCGIYGLLEARYTDQFLGEYSLFSSKKKVSMDVEGASLIDVLKVLSKQTGLNFVSSEAVRERKVTLYVENIPLQQAIDMIFKANNLTYEYYPDSNMFLIKDLGKPRIELETKVYHLKHARVQSSRLHAEIQIALGRGEEIGDEGGIIDAVVSSDGASKAVGILESIENVLSEYGTASEDPRTNALIVTDVPNQFAMIDKLIAFLDVPVPKIIIEVEMLDIKKNLTDRLGVEWQSGLKASYSGPLRNSMFPFGPLRNPLAADELHEDGFTLGAFDLTNLDVIINFFKSDQTTKILARPKILTLSGETAEIKLTVDEAINISITEDPDTQEETITVERAETGTSLRVTPHANMASREITMLVEPKVIDASQTSALSVSGSVIKDVRNRKTKSVVRLKEGESLMIGGLLRTEVTETEIKVPYLSDIPFLGAAFRHKNEVSEERELVVFLTPRIVRDESQVVDQIRPLEREQSSRAKDTAVQEALLQFRAQ